MLLEDDAAANQSMARAAEQNWFRRDSEELFPFHYYWDSPNEMKPYIDKEWEDFVHISEGVWKRARSLWTLGGAETRLRVRLNMLITRWQKVDWGAADARRCPLNMNVCDAWTQVRRRSR